MILSAIAAVSENGVIGRDNGIPWYLPKDFKWFKKTTLDHHILMGRNTFESMGRPLPKRTNIVITRDPFYVASGCVIVHSIEEGIAFAKDNGEKELFIIGGGNVYEQTFENLDKIYLTKVAVEIKGDVFFPKIEAKNWKKIHSEQHKADEKNEYDFSISVLQRKK